MADEIPLPPSCDPGTHIPVIVHRTGGPNTRSAEFYNTCGKCGRTIERGTGHPWFTAEELNNDDAIREGYRNFNLRPRR